MRKWDLIRSRQEQMQPEATKLVSELLTEQTGPEGHALSGGTQLWQFLYRILPVRSKIGSCLMDHQLIYLLKLKAFISSMMKFV